MASAANNSKPEDAIIEAMCLTWRHDFGLDTYTEFAGMTPGEKMALRLRMRQIYQHHIAPAIMAAKAEEREACAALADDHSQVLRQNFDRSCAIAIEGLAAAIRKREG